LTVHVIKGFLKSLALASGEFVHEQQNNRIVLVVNITMLDGYCAINYHREMDVMTFGKRLKKARLAAGLSQEYLALAVNCSQSTIGNIEAGPNKTSRYTVEFAQHLGVDSEWLRTGEGSMKRHHTNVISDSSSAYVNRDIEDVMMLQSREHRRIINHLAGAINNAELSDDVIDSLCTVIQTITDS